MIFSLVKNKSMLFFIVVCRTTFFFVYTPVQTCMFCYLVKVANITVPSGPSCSKLTMSLVNDLLKFTSSDTQIC